MHFSRRLLNFEQNAVDSIADFGVFFLRFNMNITGPFPQGIAEDIIDKLNNRRLTGAFFEVFNAFFGFLNQFDFAQIADDFIDVVIELGFIKGIADGLDVFGHTDNHPNIHSRLPFDIIKPEDIGRVAGGQHERIVLHSHRHQVIRADVVLVELLENLPVHLFGVQPDKLIAVQPGLGFQNRFRRNPLLFEVFFQLLPPDFLRSEFLKLFGGQNPHLRQHIRQIADMQSSLGLRAIQIPQTGGQFDLAVLIFEVG